MIINNEECFAYKKNTNYYVSRSGKIYSTYVKGAHGRTDVNNPHLLAYGQDKDGYYRVVLSFDGKRRYVKVHTVIVEQFIGDISDGMVVNHIDGNKHNNSVSNLEITTVKDNTAHAHSLGLCSVDTKVVVEYEGNVYQFNTMTACMKKFKDIRRDYLHRLANGRIEYSMVLFRKQDPNKKRSKIEAYYNGSLWKIFDTMQDADKYFGMSKGSTSSTFINNEYRSRVNKYKIYFPNVSTIENTDNN